MEESHLINELLPQTLLCCGTQGDNVILCDSSSFSIYNDGREVQISVGGGETVNTSGVRLFSGDICLCHWARTIQAQVICRRLKPLNNLSSH